MNVVETLATGYGFWNPLMWVVAFAVAIIIVFLLRSKGVEAKNEGTQQGQPYLSGNAAPDPRSIHIGGSNLYWGFTGALKGYYDRLIPMHSGILTDYVIWFLATIAVLIPIVGVIL